MNLKIFIKGAIYAFQVDGKLINLSFDPVPGSGTSFLLMTYNVNLFTDGNPVGEPLGTVNREPTFANALQVLTYHLEHNKTKKWIVS